MTSEVGARPPRLKVASPHRPPPMPRRSCCRVMNQTPKITNHRGRGRAPIVNGPRAAGGYWHLRFTLLSEGHIGGRTRSELRTEEDADGLGRVQALVTVPLPYSRAVYSTKQRFFNSSGALAEWVCSMLTADGQVAPSPACSPPALASLLVVVPHQGIDSMCIFSPLLLLQPSPPIRPPAPPYPHHDRLWISDTLSPFNRICPAQVSLYPATGRQGVCPTQVPPRLLVVRLRDRKSVV